jgi:hypothetical protein
LVFADFFFLDWLEIEAVSAPGETLRVASTTPHSASRPARTTAAADRKTLFALIRIIEILAILSHGRAARNSRKAPADSCTYVKHVMTVSRSPRHRHPRLIRVAAKEPVEKVADQHVVFCRTLASAGTSQSDHRGLRFGNIRAHSETPWRSRGDS